MHLEWLPSYSGKCEGCDGSGLDPEAIGMDAWENVLRNAIVPITSHSLPAGRRGPSRSPSQDWGAKPRGAWEEVQSTMHSDAHVQRKHREMFGLFWSCGWSSQQLVVIASRPFG